MDEDRESVTDRHPLVDVSLSRFSLTRRRYAGIVLDVFFDHCLARDWALYADRPLELFTSDVYRVLSSERQLPERLAKIAPHMVANDWLGSYREFEVLEQVLSVEQIKAVLASEGRIEQRERKLNMVVTVLLLIVMHFYGHVSQG